MKDFKKTINWIKEFLEKTKVLCVSYDCENFRNGDCSLKRIDVENGKCLLFKKG